ncbi:MAG: RIP metalloprotease RseP [Pusillimonas sp.]|nr:RIP metalloprotease RseP [Pusillimonas sp.]MBC43875.1 RIP metalloprotease RseP [Pusillimonas sp.]HCP77479.1 RIP metalloprotease RseP [Pusillimonas sp.]|tara:strand:+ start:1625 stop:2959 length:1335 start_codon:yes stop_codon:yes gene_type:complete
MIFTLLAFAVALGLLITFHELGHYWVARWCNVKVLRFSVGFGRVLLRRTDRNGTEWALSAIPLGGYVKMQDDPEAGANAQEQAQAFNRKSVGQRFAIVAAGPIANLLLAALLYAGLSWVGTEEPAAIIATPPAQTQAAQAGFQGGDRLVEINGSAVESWGQARWALLDVLTSGGNAQINVQKEQGGNATRTLQVAPASMGVEEADPLALAGLTLAAPRAQVGQVIEDGAAAAAGFQQGDIIVGLDNQPVTDANAFVAAIQKRPGERVAVTVLRGDTELMLNVVPQAQEGPEGQTVGRIGVMLAADFPMVTVRYGLLGSITHGVERTFETAWYSLKMMGRMLTGEVSVRNISGPVTIADYAGQTARIGIAAYISFLALISVSIGILNLLPIPMLDGGHLMYYLLEMARGKPVPDAWLETGQRIGLGLLVALMSLAFFNDFTRLFS